MSKVILHLGGNPNRIYKTIEVDKDHPTAKIIISSEANHLFLKDQLSKNNIDLKRVIFDDAAYDTVGNFTDTWPTVKKLRATKVYIVTSNWHMERAIAIASIVYFLRGIEIIRCSWSDNDRPDPGSIKWNVMRTLKWRFLGIQPERDYK